MRTTTAAAVRACYKSAQCNAVASILTGRVSGLFFTAYSFEEFSSSAQSALYTKRTLAQRHSAYCNPRWVITPYGWYMSTPVTSPSTPPPVKLDRVSGGVYPRSPNVSVNKNVEWINSKGAWTFYLALILLNWLLLSTVMSPGEQHTVCISLPSRSTLLQPLPSPVLCASSWCQCLMVFIPTVVLYLQVMPGPMYI